VVEGDIVSPEPVAVELLRNGTRYGRVDLEAGVPKRISVPLVVPEPAGHRLCTVTLHGTGAFNVRRLNYRAG
jgi:hypothetical protein